MKEENKVDVIEKDEVIQLFKPIDFEGTIYETLDMSALENVTTKDMIDVDRMMSKSHNMSVMSEMSLEYAIALSAKALKLPIELLEKLHPKDALSVRNRVISFLYGKE